MFAYRKKCREIKKEIEIEERNTNFFQQERERINYIWMVQKRKIDEGRTELLNKQKEKEEQDETNKIERKLYYQKIKYLMLRYQDENVELQKEDEITLKQFEDSNRIKEKDYKYDIRSLSKMKKEQEVLQNDFTNALDKESIKAIHQLKNEYELKEYQVRRSFREKMKEMRNNATEKRNKKIDEIINKKTREIKNITEEHATQFNSMKSYYSELNKKNLTQLKILADNFKKEHQEQTNLKNQKQSKMAQRKKNEEPLKKYEDEIEKLVYKEKICQENFSKLKEKNEQYNCKFFNKIVALIKELLNHEYKYEVILQKINYLEKEKESFMNKYKLNLHSVEQHAGLRVIF